MAVYVDNPQRWGARKWCHLIGDTLEELHAFAARIGLRRCWFQPTPRASHPHYDLTGSRIQAAIDAGAVLCDRPTFVGHVRRLRAAQRAEVARG